MFGRVSAEVERGPVALAVSEFVQPSPSFAAWRRARPIPSAMERPDARSLLVQRAPKPQVTSTVVLPERLPRPTLLQRVAEQGRPSFVDATPLLSWAAFLAEASGALALILPSRGLLELSAMRASEHQRCAPFAP